jgi:hypothetical protein
MRTSAACALLLLCLRPAGAAAPKKSESRFHLAIRKAFPQADIPAAGGTDDENSYRFQVFDEHAGYARLVGPFQGYQDFFFIRGKGREHLISVEYQCPSACSQRVTIQRFVAGAEPAPVPLMDLLDLSRFSDVRRRLMSLCLDAEGGFDTQPEARDKPRRALPSCPFVFSFPKKSSDASMLFKVVDENGSDLLLSVGKTKVSPEARLRWNGAQFVGTEPGGDEAVFLNDDKMRALF